MSLSTLQPFLENSVCPEGPGNSRATARKQQQKRGHGKGEAGERDTGSLGHLHGQPFRTRYVGAAGNRPPSLSSTGSAQKRLETQCEGPQAHRDLGGVEQTLHWKETPQVSLDPELKVNQVAHLTGQADFLVRDIEDMCVTSRAVKVDEVEKSCLGKS